MNARKHTIKYFSNYFPTATKEPIPRTETEMRAHFTGLHHKNGQQQNSVGLHMHTLFPLQSQTERIQTLASADRKRKKKSPTLHPNRA